MLVGLTSAILAGALWGLAFIAPAAVAPFTPIDITVGRYLVLGLMSLALLQGWSALDRRTRRDGILIGALGYTAYYIPVAIATLWAGPTVTTLIIGLLPLTLGIIGNWRDRVVEWSRLVLPLGLSLAGVVLVNWAALAQFVLPADRLRFFGGVGLALIGLAVWAIYAVWNAAALRNAPAPVNARLWTSLQGVGAAVSCLPIIVMVATLGGSHLPQAQLFAADTTRFVFWSLTMGVAASYAANWFWTIAAKRLSVALTGQLIVSETLFGLLYGFVFVQRWPGLAEALGAALMIVGVVIAVRVFEAARKQPRSAP